MSEKSKISMELCHKLSMKPVHPERCVHCTFNYKEARPPRNFPMPGVKERNEALCKRSKQKIRVYTVRESQGSLQWSGAK